MLPRARFQASRWALLNPAGGEWSRTDSRGQVLRNQPSAIGHGHNDVRWMRMFMFRRRNPKSIDLQKCNGFERKHIDSETCQAAAWAGAAEVKRNEGDVGWLARWLVAGTPIYV